MCYAITFCVSLHVCLLTRLLSLQQCRHPAQQVRKYFTSVGLIEHFMSSARIRIVSDFMYACETVALNQGFDSFELLADWICAA